MSVINHAKIIHYINTLSPALLDVEAVSNVTVSNLPQGVWNLNYLAQINDKKFVLKVYQNWPRTRSMFTANSGRREFETLKLLEGLNIAPKPILFDNRGTLAGRDLMIYEYATGNTLTYSDRVMVEAAGVYAKLHSLNPDRAAFLQRRDESLLALMTGIKLKYVHYVRRGDIPPTLQAQFARYIERSEKHIAGQKSGAYPQSIIHADPVAGNVIVAPSTALEDSKLILIDWQTVMIGDPAFDIWAFTSAPFALWDLDATPSEDQRDLFRQTYLSLQNDPTLEERIALKEPLYLLEYGLHLSTRYYDYKSGNMPPLALIGREANFEKYGPNAEVALESLRELLG